MVSPLTAPAVLAKYERAQSDGSVCIQLRELFAQHKRGIALALFHAVRCAHGRPCASTEMEVIRLDRQFQDRPSFLLALLSNQFLAPCANLIDKHRATTLGAPDEMLDHEMHVMFVVLIR
jgi:hypothetical protein